MSVSILDIKKSKNSVTNINVSYLGSDVRSKAFQAVDQFLQILKQYHDKVCNYLFSN